MKATLSTPNDLELRIERFFNASRDRVWKAINDPKLIAQWWGRGHRLDIEKFDPVPGGQWRFVEHVPGGNKEGFSGHFREVVAPERVVQTFEWDGMPGHQIVETMTLEVVGPERTRLVTVSRFASKADRDGMMQSGMEDGLNQSYAALDQVLARL